MNKKVLILGANSFVARSLIDFFKTEKVSGLEIVSLSRKECDLTSFSALNKIFEKSYYDCVINCAIAGGGRLLVNDTDENFFDNILIQQNILAFKERYGRLIAFGSGAEFDRSLDVLHVEEGDIGMPNKNRYSLAKSVNYQLLKDKSFVSYLRIFNVFGELERDDRFIKSNIRKYINKQNIEIWGDAYFDFFYIEDLCKVVKKEIFSKNYDYVEYNLVYKNKYLLSEIAKIINSLSSQKVNIKITGKAINNHYTGKGDRLSRVGLTFVGLERGLKNVFNYLKNERIH